MTESTVTSQKPDAAGIGVAAVGGGGIGTLLAGAAQFLPEASKWRVFLVMVAPAISVALSSLWIWATEALQKYLDKRETERTLQQLRDYLYAKVHDPDMLPAMKEMYQEQLVELEKAYFERRIKVVVAS